MTELWNALLMAGWAALWLFIGYLAGRGKAARATRSQCLHWWEIVGQPWKQDVWSSSYATLRPKSFWHERCSACGELRTASVWGTWTLKELTGEESLGVAKPTLEVGS